jgi:hypothetical protein
MKNETSTYFNKIEISIVIISMPNSSSARALKLILEETVSPKSIVIMEASTPGDLNLEITNKGSRTTPIEKSISLSHHRARRIALDSSPDWAIILEEDALLTSNPCNFYDFFSEIDKRFMSDRPLAVHFAPEQFGIMLRTKNTNFLTSFVLADCAVAYGLNRASLIYSCRYLPALDEVADWPKYMRKLKWLSPIQSIFLHPDLKNNEAISSTIKVRTEHRISHNTFSKIFNTSLIRLATFSFCSRFGKVYGEGYSVNEKFRSRVLQFNFINPFHFKE